MSWNFHLDSELRTELFYNVLFIYLFFTAASIYILIEELS